MSMFKKIVVGTVAAAALSLPLSPAVLADPTPDNPGLPGSPNFGGIAPGEVVSGVAKYPGSVPEVAAPPGTVFSTLTPGQTGTAGQATTSCVVSTSC